jgi:nucleoside-triphosphatase THEP1
MEAGDRTGFNLEDLRTGECTPLSRITPEQGAVRWGRFYFFPEGIKAGNHALQDNGILHPDLTVVDEVGPFELQRGIWADHLDEMAFISPRPLLWVVRAELVNDVIERWRFSDPQVFTIPVNAHQAADVIAERITTWNISSSIAPPDPDQNLL